MAAPPDIVEALECVLSAYFSGGRHNLRAAFILCDGLLELTCKAKVDPRNLITRPVQFDDHLRDPAVLLDPATVPLGARAQANHYLRNKMHHINSAATVDTQRCASAIVDAVDCIEHCFPGAKAAFDLKIQVALRVVRIFSATGSGAHRAAFQDGMSRYAWRTEKRQPRVHETIVQPGMRSYWGLVMLDSVADIETILNRIGAP